MARLICRLPADHSPSAQEARKQGIDAWLVRASLNSGGELELMAPVDWQPDLPFCLEWQIKEPLTPRLERQAAERLIPWLMHPLQLRWRGRRPLWIRTPERLSNPYWAGRRLRLAFGPDLMLWGLGPVGRALDGRYHQPEQEWRCRRVNGALYDYESYLFHAHHLGGGSGITVPAVLPWNAELEQRYVNLGGGQYNEWLALAMAWVDLRHGLDGEGALVLVEGWEGHCRWWIPSKNPGPKFRTTSSTCSTRGGIAASPTVLRSNTRPALVVHGYHLTELKPLLASLQSWQGVKMALYMSTTQENYRAATALAAEMGWSTAEIVTAENRGRDMAPFVLDLLPRVVANGHPWLLKLHTKRSSHLQQTGQAWAAHLRRNLGNPAAIRDFGKGFAEAKELGLMAAPGTLLPSTISLNCNEAHLHGLLDALGIPSNWWLEQPFVAGSMYAVRSEALKPLLSLQLSREAFEEEGGQHDGTLAHALERVVAALVILQGLLVKEVEGASTPVPPFGYGWAAPT